MQGEREGEGEREEEALRRARGRGITESESKSEREGKRKGKRRRKRESQAREVRGKQASYSAGAYRPVLCLRSRPEQEQTLLSERKRWMIEASQWAGRGRGAGRRGARLVWREQGVRGTAVTPRQGNIT